MKVYKLPPKPQFMPVNLVLETQEEIDAICTIVNSQRITQVFPALDGWWKKLSYYGNYKLNWIDFDNIIRK